MTGIRTLADNKLGISGMDGGCYPDQVAHRGIGQID